MDRFPSPNSTWTVAHLLSWDVHHIRRIQRPGIIFTLSFTLLTFLNLVQWWKGGLVVLISPNIHYHAHQKYPVSHWNLDTSVLWTHSHGPNSVHFRGAALCFSSLCTQPYLRNWVDGFPLHPSDGKSVSPRESNTQLRTIPKVPIVFPFISILKQPLNSRHPAAPLLLESTTWH